MNAPRAALSPNAERSLHSWRSSIWNEGIAGMTKTGGILVAGRPFPAPAIPSPPRPRA